MTVPYATPAELRAQGIAQITTTDDTLLTMLLLASAEAINNFCNRPDGFIAENPASARVYSGSGTAVQWIDECVEITAVAVKSSPSDDTYTAWLATDWLPFSGDPEYPNFNKLPYHALMVTATGAQAIFISGEYPFLRGFRPLEATYERSVPTVQVTAKWGVSVAAPTVIKEASLILAARWYKRSQSAWADTLANADFGQLQFRKVIDPDVQFMLRMGRFVKPPIGRR